jgi:1-phosphofructokinase family hexose kinase
MREKLQTAIAVVLNPAIDRVIEVEALDVGEHVRGRSTDRHPAGKAVNVARVLGQLGHAAMLTGFVGEAEAAWFEKFVAADGVRAQLFAVPGATRENITLLERDTKRELHVRDVGFTVRDEDVERLASKITLLCRPGVALIFSGSLPQGLSEDAFVGLIRRGIERGAQVAVDCSGPAAHAAVREKLWLVKPNPMELEAMAGRPVGDLADQVAAARALTQTVEAVLLSRGADGAVLVNADTALAGRVPLEPTEVHNTVGCGDALLAGFLAGLLEGRPDRDALVRGLAAATAAAVRPATGQIATDRLEEFAASATVETL